MLVQIGFEVVSRGRQVQEVVQHVDPLLVVVVFAKEVLHVAHYQNEVVVGVAVGCHIIQVTEELNLERALNLGTAR